MDLPAPTEIAGLLAQGPSVTTADFLARFGQLYDAVWPAQLLAIAGAVGVYELTRRQRHDRTGLLLIVLALAWAWTGWSYHGHHFAEVTPLSGLYMLGFLVQSVLLLLAALANPSLRAESASTRAGHALVLVGVLLIPILPIPSGGSVGGYGLFGLTADATAITTLGAVLCLRGALRWVLGVIPAAWCFIAADTAAALHLPALLAGPALAAMAVLVAMAGGAAQSARLDRA